MKKPIVLIILITASTVADASCTTYVNKTREMNASYSCAAGDTPLGFQCITMTYPELTTDINDYPCFTVENVAGRHIEVLVEPVNPIMQLRTCINEDGFTEQCTNGVNNYCERIQSQNNSTIIRVFCLTGGCETSIQLLWFRIDLSPRGIDTENWCLTRSQDTPSNLINFLQPINQTSNFDQDGDCRIYVNQSREVNPMYNCSAGDTPLGFHCLTATNSCLSVENATGRFIEVLIEPVTPTANVTTCIREEGFPDQCSTGINSYCDRVQSQSGTINIHIFCQTGDCETGLWVRIDLSPNDITVENWCSTRPQLTPSSLNNIQQPNNQTDDDNDQSGFGMLQPFPATSLLIFTVVLKLMLS